MIELLGACQASLMITALAVMGTMVLAVTAPRVLGRATSIIFESVVFTTLPAGTTKAQATETLRAQGMDDFATMLLAMDVIPGAGIGYARLGRTLMMVLGLYVGSGLLSWLQGWLINCTTIRVLYRLHAQAEGKVHHPPLSYLDTVQYDKLLGCLANDADNVINTLQQSLSDALAAIPAVVGVLGMMFSIPWKLALVTLIMPPLIGAVFEVIGPHSRKAFTHQWTHTGKINTRMGEFLSGRALVQIYGHTASVREAFAAEGEELFRVSLYAQFLSGIMMSVMLVIGNINYVAIMVVGGVMVASGSLRLGDVRAFIQYSQQSSQPLGQLGGMATAAQFGTTGAERIFELLGAEEEHPDDAVPGSARAGPSAAAASLKSPAGPGVTEMEHMRFSYSPEAKLIRDLSLQVDPGHTAAVAGPTGADKTTLINLLMRFYKLDGGRTLVSERDIATMMRRDVRCRIGMVLQDPWLFAGTIRESIRYGRLGASNEEVGAVARACFVDHIIKALSQGYDTVLEKDVVNISAGERQLLAIARAFVANPAVLILDEATSPVNAHTELLAQQAMDALREGRTSFIIIHRLSMICDTGTILVMERGDTVEQGSHDEFIAAGGAYVRPHAT